MSPRTNDRPESAHGHPYLFSLIALCALAELGLTAFLLNVGNTSHEWASVRYHHLLILFAFNAAWTLLFAAAYVAWTLNGAVHAIASIASSIIWLTATTILWGAASGIMLHTRTGGTCPGKAPISRCRQSLTVMSVGWAEFGLCVCTLIATCWLAKRGDKKPSRESYVEV